MLELMAHHVLTNILESLHTSPILAVMVDETTDKSNKEQLTPVVRWVSEDYSVRGAPGAVLYLCTEHCVGHERCLLQFKIPF